MPREKEVKRKPGRPPWEPTEDDINQVERLSALGLSNENIAYFFDKNADTIYQRINDTPAFKEAIKKGKAKACGKVLNALWSKIEGGDTACILFYLKTQMGWKETQVVENTGKDGEAIQHDVKFSESEMRKRIKEIVSE